MWLRDANDNAITPDALSVQLGLARFRNDPYRGFVYFTRDIGYVQRPEIAAFHEFYWGTWLRARLDLSSVDLGNLTTYLDHVKNQSQAMTALGNDDIVAYGKTALDVGKLASWNAGSAENKGEFAKLSKPLSDPKRRRPDLALPAKRFSGAPRNLTRLARGWARFEKSLTRGRLGGTQTHMNGANRVLALAFGSASLFGLLACPGGQSVNEPGGTGGAQTGGTSGSGGSPSGTGGGAATGGTGGNAATGGAGVGSGGGGTGGTTTGSGGGVATGGNSATGGSAAGGSVMTGGRGGSAGTPGAGGRAAATGGAGGRGVGGGSTGGTGSTARFSFFITSLPAMRQLSGSQNGFGGDLRFGEATGLAGADKICTNIANASMAGNGKTWRAFLSVGAAAPGGAVNAIDRVGPGPWYDRMGRLVSMTSAGLLNARPQGAETAILNDLPNENGIPNHNPDGAGQVDNHHVLTGASTTGGLYSATGNCSNWTSTASTAGRPRVGFSWIAGGRTHWMSGQDEGGCGAGVGLEETGGSDPSNPIVGSGGGYGAIYCFALTP